MKSKIYDNPAAGLNGLLFDGMTIMSGGFGLSGNPESLIPEIRAAGINGLTVISNNAGADGFGIPAFFTKTGVGTLVAEGKLVETIEGEEYVRESWLRADLSIIKAWRADPAGNLMFRKTARNFNPNMATAGKVTVVEVEEIVPAGSFDPDCIHTPGIYIDRIVLSTINEKRIEKLTTRPREEMA